MSIMKKMKNIMHRIIWHYDVSKNLENKNDIDNIIKFIDCLEGVDKNKDKKKEKMINKDKEDK